MSHSEMAARPGSVMKPGQGSPGRRRHGRRPVASNRLEGVSSVLPCGIQTGGVVCGAGDHAGPESSGITEELLDICSSGDLRQ